MQPPHRVCVLGQAQTVANELEELRADGFVVVELALSTRSQAVADLAALARKGQRFDAFIIVEGNHLVGRLDAEIFEPFLPELRYVGGAGAGYDHVDIDWLAKEGVVYANSPVAVSEPTATTATMLILQAVRAASQAEIAVRAGKWRKGLQITPDVRDLVVGIVGMGMIGKLVQQKIEALGMRVIYYNRRRLPPDEEGNAQYVSFDELIRTADVISLHCPLTSGTYHLLSDAEFKKMKDGVFIVNTARGKVIDENALVRAMKSQKVCRAALDVYEHEPQVHPWLAESDRTTLLPHWGIWTTRVVRDTELEVMDNFRAWLHDGIPNTPTNVPIPRQH